MCWSAERICVGSGGDACSRAPKKSGLLTRHGKGPHQRRGPMLGQVRLPSTNYFGKHVLELSSHFLSCIFSQSTRVGAGGVV